GEQLLTPLRVFEYIRAVHDFRHRLRREPGSAWPVGYGHLVVSVAEHPLSIALFRELVPSQRQALAADWARAVEAPESEYESLRRHLRATKPSDRFRRELSAARVWLRENPEWVLAAVTGLALVVAV